MIYPSIPAVLLIALGAPISAVLGSVRPELWALGIAWSFAVLLLTVLDGLIAPRLRQLSLDPPVTGEIGAPLAIPVAAEFVGGVPGRAETRLTLDRDIADMAERTTRLTDRAGGALAGTIPLASHRRGAALIAEAWLRWRGPLGLAWKQVKQPREDRIAILPRIGEIRSPAFQIYLRDAMFGLIARRFRGEGSEFEAIADYQPGMDRRAIDWKVSARHTALRAKEYETERNNQIIFALDSGQAMCEPVAGLPRIDRAVSAALIAAYVALKSGDKVKLFGFAARPQVNTAFFQSSRNFHRLQNSAADIDYSATETNYTLGLSTLAAGLQRRSLIVIFTEFTDPTSAELMLESVGRLIDRHLVLFVVLEDSELTELAEQPPVSADAMAEAVTAGALLRQRELVINRLRHLGVDVIQAPHQLLGTRLVNAYLSIKQRGSI